MIYENGADVSTTGVLPGGRAYGVVIGDDTTQGAVIEVGNGVSSWHIFLRREQGILPVSFTEVLDLGGLVGITVFHGVRKAY